MTHHDFNCRKVAINGKNEKDKMPWSAAIIMLLFGILLPSWDVFSDLLFTYNLFIPKKCLAYTSQDYIDDFYSGAWHYSKSKLVPKF